MSGVAYGSEFEETGREQAARPPARRDAPSSSPSTAELTPALALALQASAGNAAVGRLLREGKLETGAQKGVGTAITERFEPARQRKARLEPLPAIVSGISGQLGSKNFLPGVIAQQLLGTESTLRETGVEDAAGNVAIARALVETLDLEPEEILSRVWAGWGNAVDSLNAAVAASEAEFVHIEDSGALEGPALAEERSKLEFEQAKLNDMIGQLEGCRDSLPSSVEDWSEAAYEIAVAVKQALRWRPRSPDAADQVAAASQKFEHGLVQFAYVKKDFDSRRNEARIFLSPVPSMIKKRLRVLANLPGEES